MRTTTNTFYPWGGYECIEAWESEGWHAIAGWGRDGWDLGSWPLVIVFHRLTPEPSLAYYVEGDIRIDRFATIEERDAATDELAFFHWRAQSEPWIADIPKGQEPAYLRGRFSWARLDAETKPAVCPACGTEWDVDETPNCEGCHLSWQAVVAIVKGVGEPPPDPAELLSLARPALDIINEKEERA